MTFSRCRRLNVHRKTGYPSFLYPLANVRPLTTMSWRGNWCILGTTKRRKPIFYHVSSLFFILLSWARDVRCVTSKVHDDTLFYRLPMTSSCRYPGLTTLHSRTYGEGTGLQLTAGTPVYPPPLKVMNWVAPFYRSFIFTMAFTVLHKRLLHSANLLSA